MQVARSMLSLRSPDDVLQPEDERSAQEALSDPDQAAPDAGVAWCRAWLGQAQLARTDAREGWGSRTAAGSRDSPAPVAAPAASGAGGGGTLPSGSSACPAAAGSQVHPGVGQCVGNGVYDPWGIVIPQLDPVLDPLKALLLIARQCLCSAQAGW